MSDQVLFRIRRRWDRWDDDLEIRYAYKRFDMIEAAIGVTMTTVQPHMALPSDPMMVVPNECGQQMIDELWNLGFRPSQELKQEVTNLVWMQEQLAKFIGRATR